MAEQRETFETGIVIADKVMSGTAWCLRQHSAWWSALERADRYQMRPRADRVDMLVGHWTAGEAGKKTYEDDGARVVSVMKRRKSRKRPDRRLKVSIQFVIGACDPDDEWAPIWQTMDLALDWAAVHVGLGSINARSIGVEVVNAGLDGHTNVRDRPEIEVDLLGQKRDVLAFYPGQLNTWVRLANVLSGACLPGNIEIPRFVPGELPSRGQARPLSRRMTKREIDNFAGCCEHYHMPNTRKICASSQLVGALLDDGWSPVEP